MAEAVISVTVGRPPSINPSECVIFHVFEQRGTDSIASFDVDPPIDCDDEYWENPDPALAFKQPEGKPSKLSFFLSLLKLTEIHYATQRAFVSCCQFIFFTSSPNLAHLPVLRSTAGGTCRNDSR